jgi:hypothetical protein
MRSNAIFVVLLLASLASGAGETAAPPALPIDGIWLSDRDLTLAELQKAQTWPERQWKALSDPTLFGHMVQVIRGHTALAAVYGSCQPPEQFVVLESSASRVRVRVLDPQPGEAAEVEFQIVDGNLHLPMMEFESRPHEVFRRATVEEATREQPCLAQILGAAK